MNNPELTQAALDILRDGSHFQWYNIALLAVVVYIYANEFQKKNWNLISAGLALYVVHWFYEIVNALIQHFSGHALWTVPSGTGYLLLVGVGWELSMMFAVAGLIMAKLLPEDKNVKVFGINNRIVFAVGNAAFFSIFEIFLASTSAFHWVFSWWGALPVFITTYIPFFLAAFWAHDAESQKRRYFIAGFAVVDVLLFVFFALLLRWI